MAISSNVQSGTYVFSMFQICIGLCPAKVYGLSIKSIQIDPSNSFLRTFHPKAYCCMSILFQPPKNIEFTPNPKLNKHHLKSGSFSFEFFRAQNFNISCWDLKLPGSPWRLIRFSHPQKKGDFNSPWWFWWGHHFSQVTSVINYQKYLTLSRQTKGHDSIKHVLALGHPNLRWCFESWWSVGDIS